MYGISTYMAQDVGNKGLDAADGHIAQIDLPTAEHDDQPDGDGADDLHNG